LSDIRVENFARILVDYSTQVKAGDRVAIITGVEAEDLLRVMYGLILERGAYPHILLEIHDQDELLFKHASDELLDFIPPYQRHAFEDCDVLIKVRADANTRALSGVSSERLARRQKATSSLIAAQMARGASGALRWMSTLYPTRAYALEAEMGFEEYKDFVFNACYADPTTKDPVAAWQAVRKVQQRYIDRIQGHDRVELHGPDVDLSLSIKERIFDNACGLNNMPDGEIYTGPVEESVNGWVRYTYPAMVAGKVVEGIELTFKDGKVVQATAQKNQDLLEQMLETDAGARYVGEFAIGTNYQVDRFTKSILFDEKIGGSFHMALGAGYPETGSKNKSHIHWDMICDMRQDSQILVDGDMVYQNGRFLD